MKTLKTANDYKSLFREILDLTGVSEKMLKQFQNKAYPQPGDFLLKNGEYAKSTVYDQEAGIYFAPNLYLDLVGLNDIPKDKLIALHAEGWCGAKKILIPTLDELAALQTQVSAVNSSLCDVGMRKFLLPSNLVDQYWYQEILHNPQEKDKTRKVIPIGYKENVPNAVAFMAKLQPLFIK